VIAEPARAASASLASDLLSCFRFDPGGRIYGARIQRYFRVGAVLVFVTLASLLGGLVARERRRRA
jgi:hypothetical protein